MKTEVLERLMQGWAKGGRRNGWEKLVDACLGTNEKRKDRGQFTFTLTTSPQDQV